MSEKLKDELEHFKKRIEHAIIGEYEWFVSWSAENIETDLREHFEAKEKNLNTTIDRHEEKINILEKQVEEMQKTLEWYADESRYEQTDGFLFPKILYDRGERARQALKGDPNESLTRNS